MAYILGEGRTQGTLFPVVLEDFVLADHICCVIDAFVEKLKMLELGFERAHAARVNRHEPHLNRLTLRLLSRSHCPSF